MTATDELRAMLTPQVIRRGGLFALCWICVAMLVAALEVASDPLTAWEQTLNVTFGLLIPSLALVTTFSLARTLTSPTAATALAARHGADRRRNFTVALLRFTVPAVLLSGLGLLSSRVFCVGAHEQLWNRDLLTCCGIGCLATVTYMAYLLLATRLGIGKYGPWLALGLDLTLGHVSAGWSIVTPHQHVMRLIGHPGIFSLSAKASSWILLAVAVAGLSITIAKTPR